MNEPMHPENAGTAILQDAKRAMRKYNELYAEYISLSNKPCTCEIGSSAGLIKCDRCSKQDKIRKQLLGLLPSET